MTMRLLFSMFFFLFFFGAALAQKDTLSNYEKYDLANEYYNRGKLKDVLEILVPVLETDKEITSTLRASMYKLAAQTSFLLQQPQNAQKYLILMLSFDPYYQPKNSDLPMLKLALDTLHALPRLSLGVRMGMNVSPVKVEKRYSLLTVSSEDKSQYRVTHRGFQFGFTSEFAVSKTLSLVAQASFVRQQFLYHRTISQLLENNNEQYTENLYYAEIPLIVRYRFKEKQYNKTRYTFIRPYLQTGLFYKHLIMATKDYQETLMSVGSGLNQYDWGLCSGAGITYYLKHFSLAIEADYMHGFRLINDPEKRYSNDQSSDIFMYKFYNIADDLKLRNVQLSINISYYLNYKVF